MKNIFSFLVLIIAWEILGKQVDSSFFVSFTEAIQSLIYLLKEQQLIVDIGTSFQRIFIALSLCFIIAIPLGIGIGRIKEIESLFRPLTHFLRYIPAPTLIPISILWLGIGEAPKIFIVLWGIFFPTLLSIRDAAKNIPKSYHQVSRSLGYTKWQNLYHVSFPAIAPEIFNAFRIAWGESWIYLLIAELISAENGIGKSIVVAQRFLKMDQIFALILLLGIIGLISDQSFKFTYSKLFRYK